MRADLTPSLAGGDEATLPVKETMPSGVFAGMHFLFWVVAFAGPLKQG